MGILSELVHTILIWMTDLGYWGIMLGLMIEVIPSEIILSYGGYLSIFISNMFIDGLYHFPIWISMAWCIAVKESIQKEWI